MSSPSSSSGKTLVWGLFILLFFAHQDFWLWDDGSLVLGFMPIGLAYHALFSIGCAALGWLAIKTAWPHDLEAFAEESSSNAEEKEPDA